MSFSKLNTHLGTYAYDEGEMFVSAYEKPDGTRTFWFKAGAAIMELPEDLIDIACELLQHAKQETINE